MTSNKNKRSTPHKSPHKSSTHKLHKPGKAHKPPKEKVAPARQSLPILPQKDSEVVPPILPPTRRILFPQSLKKSNSQQPFLSPHSVKTDHQKTKKHTLSSPAAKFSDDRPFKKPCLSSPSPAKRTRLLPVTPERVNGRERTVPSSDDEDENGNEKGDGDGTPNPPSRKRKANSMAGAAGNHKKTPPPRTSVAVVIPSKQQPSSSLSTINPNSPAVRKVDITVLRLEKEELQHRLNVSSQQAQKAMNEVKEWENRCKETADVQDNLNRLLRAEIEDKERLQKQLESFREQAHGLNLEAKNWEDKWKEAAGEINVLRKRFELETKTRKGDELTTEKWRLRYISEHEKTTKLQRELKQIQNAPEAPHLTQKIEQLELELSNLKSIHHLPKTSTETPQETHPKSPAPHLTKQLSQPKSELPRKNLLMTTLTQYHNSPHQLSTSQNPITPTPNPHSPTQIITHLTTQIQTLQQELLQKEHLSLRITQLTSSLDFQSDILSQAARTHLFETTALHQQIAHLKEKLSSQDKLAEELSEFKKEFEKMREENLDKDEEMGILNAEFEEERGRWRREVERWEGEVRMKDRGLQRMGGLVAGWVLKWRSMGGGGGGGEGRWCAGGGGSGICVDGVRL
ncbi:uncharacterized protein EAF02_009832 [Botrytis sinoallii]|uniref:uncharacterized protein n=1 Tax=Botrytis sinoallii TaxID=1463999 RepID=UPI0019019266|nr:uncharacterized protein EAF02_009832 [Botrytis sinoallii]KAF7867046.1 hypothetical protein EAF02_009832 [Botrytis sinoallii]